MGKYQHARISCGTEQSILHDKIIQKRVWVKTARGSPTSIMISEFDIIDDLKAAVFQRYPNTLAKSHDSSDLRVFVAIHGREHPSIVKSSKSKVSISRFKSEPEDSTRKALASDGLMTNISFKLLEPDKNVWEALEEHFENGMKMSDALWIDATNDQPHVLSSKFNSGTEKMEEIRFKDLVKTCSPSPSHSNIKRPSVAINALHTPKPQNPQQFSHVLEKYSPDSSKMLSELSPVGHSHKRSQSSPSQSPISLTPSSKSSSSQAVLLLPRNFSLGEQHPLKRLSLDENLIHKSGSASKHSSTNSRSVIDERQNALVDNAETTLQIKGATDSAHSKNQQPPQTFDKPSQISSDNNRKDSNTNSMHQKVSLHPIVEKKLNTSTFQQVLPSISVLVVEDNSINQAILGAFLRKHKIRYQIAKNGQEAVDKWRKGGFHLVLMDIQLPVKSGIEATKEIRLLERVNRIGVFAQHELSVTQAAEKLEIKESQKLDLTIFRSPVIIVALTASSNSSIDRKNALTAGCNDYLTKPVNLVWLQNKITEWGCMQALIDFDGWRWKGSPSTS